MEFVGGAAALKSCHPLSPSGETTDFAYGRVLAQFEIWYQNGTPESLRFNM